MKTLRRYTINQEKNIHWATQRKLLVSQALPLPFLGTAFPFLLQIDCKDRQK